MTKVVSRGTVESRGVGRPDYSQFVQRSQQFARVNLRTDESFKFFCVLMTDEITPYSWKIPPLEADKSVHLIDPSTGKSTPYTVKKGYVLSIFAVMSSVDKETEGIFYADGFPVSSSIPHVRGFDYTMTAKAVDTTMIDPYGLAPHDFDEILKNVDTESCKGFVGTWCLLQKKGTPEIPTTKQVKCRVCGNLTEVPRREIRVICSKCGEETRYLPIFWGGEGL